MKETAIIKTLAKLAALKARDSVQSTMRTGIVLVKPMTTTVAPVSDRDLVKVIIEDDITPFFIIGKVMVLKTVRGEAPKVFAASSTSLSIP